MNKSMETGGAVFIAAIKPDICTRHYRFEMYVRQTLFPQTRYDLVLKKSDDPAGESVSPGALIEPHFKLKSRYSEFVFYVEPRYIPQQSDPMVEWCGPSEFTSYRELDGQLPVYILIGEGPQPAEPYDVYLFPIKNAKYNRMLRSHLEKYKIPAYLEIFGKDLISMRSAR